MFGEFLITDFLIFLAVGFLAQLVDGALGMAYGVTSTTALLTFGVAPATASASVHAAKMFTTAASGASHAAHKNVDWKLFFKLTPAGVIGGMIGAYVLTSIDGNTVKPFIVGYLGVMGIVILYRVFRPSKPRPVHAMLTSPLGLAGGFVDAVGGGGWGPVVTSSLMGAGGEPRYVIGTVNTSEFFVSVATSTAFLVALISGHWENTGDLVANATAVAGLIFGGLVAAPLGGWMVKSAPQRALGALVGVLVIGLSIYQAWRFFA